MSLRSSLKQMLERVPTYQHVRARLRFAKVGYAQFGEDAHLRGFYDRLAHDRGIVVDGGLIVDVGAFHPYALSNTYGYYLQGWRCVNIDPTPGSKRLFDQVRPRDTNLEIAIAEVEGEATFYLFGAPSVWNTLDASAARHASEITGQTPAKQSVPARRLESVLDEYRAGKPFEILVIDAEGLDIEILRSNDFDRHRPRVILIEVHHLTAETLHTHAVHAHLSALGYRLHSWINPNLLFVREDSWLGDDAPKPCA